MKKIVTILAIIMLTATFVSAEAPARFSLGQNYPNPFNPTTAIPFTLSQPSSVRLTVYDLLGKHVRLLIDEEKPAGSHRVVWDGLDDFGRPSGAGVYFYKMTSDDSEEMRRMVLIR